MSIEVSPRDFIFGVLSIAKEVYGENAKYISRTRAVKLVCMVAEDIESEAIPRGWYRFGIYSFKVDSLIKDNFAGNLMATELPLANLPKDLGEKIKIAVKATQNDFVQQRGSFMKWIHYQVAPKAYRNFYKCHDEFLGALDSITKPSGQKAILMHPYDWIGEIITRYNPCLNYVPEDRQSLFFDYTDQLEGLLLVAKRRNLRDAEVRHLLGRFKSLYNSKVYPCITPFEDSLKGKGKEEELQVFRKSIMHFFADATLELSSIKLQIEKSGLLPTLEEFDQEILERVDCMKESERANLSGAFRVLT